MKKTICYAFLAGLLGVNSARAGSFIFASNANGLTGSANATLVGSDIDLTIAVGAAGAVLNESDSDGMGIDSTGIAGVTDSSSSKLNVLGGVSAGQGESLTFSFSHDGVLDGLLFDGLKDEPLEYFSLELPGGSVLSLFDFEVEMRLNHQGFNLSDMGVPNPTQADGPNDDFSGLAIPFSAGEVFTLTYGEVDYDGSVLPGYYPADNNLNPTGDLPNGARFQGVQATAVPEPGALVLCVIGSTAFLAMRRRRPE